MKVFVFFLIFFYSEKTFAENYIDYNSSIANADSLLLNNEIAKAINLYHVIFNKYEKCFPNDAYVAAQAACLVNNYYEVSFFLKKGFQFGLNKHVLTEPIFAEFVKSDNFQNLTKIYDSLRFEYKSKINQKYRAQVLVLRNKDLNSNPTHSTLAILGLRNKKSNIWAVDSCRSYCNSLMELYKEYGAPSIDNIGVIDQSIRNLTDTSLYGTGYSSTLGWFLLWHYPYAFQEWETVLLKALKDGDISSFYYAVCRDFSSRWYLVGGLKKSAKKSIKYKDIYYHVRWSIKEPANIDEINERRRKIGLCSLSVEKQKQIAQNKYNFFFHDTNTLPKTLINYNYFIL